MLMDYLVTEKPHQEHEPTALALSFAFQRDGSELTHSLTGLFRSLLHQMLSHDAQSLTDFLKETEFEERCEKYGQPEHKWQWREEELEKHFKHHLQRHLQQVTVHIYLDALDEGGEETAMDVVSLFQHVSQDSRRRSFVCFSSRPQQFLNAQYDFDVGVEQHNVPDAEALIDLKLAAVHNLIDSHDFGEIKSSLMQKASGILLWIGKIIPKVIPLIQDMTPLRYILAKIEGFPKALDKIYEDELNSIDQDDVQIALRVFMWLCLGQDQINVRDLRYAICITDINDLASIEDLKTSMYWLDNDVLLLNSIRRFSCGFLRDDMFQLYADDSKQAGISIRSSSLLYDHGSVYTFTLERGLQILHGRLAPISALGTIALMHLSMAKDCLHYLKCDAVFESTEYRFDFLNPSLQEADVNSQSVAGRLPFANYAADCWKNHLMAAEPNGATSSEIDQAIRTPGVKGCQNITKMQTTREHGCSWENSISARFMHSLCAHDMTKSVNALLTASESEPCKRLLEDEDIDGVTPFRIAAKSGHQQIVDMVLQHGGDVNHGDRSGITPLHVAAGKGHDDVVRALLGCSTVNVDAKDSGDAMPLHYAVRHGHVTTAELLLRRSKHGPHSEGSKRCYLKILDYTTLRTPLTDAVCSQGHAMVKMLLSCPNVDPNLTDEMGNTTLHIFMSGVGKMENLQLLLDDSRFPIDARNSAGLTPFAYGAQSGYVTAVDALLRTKRADVRTVNNGGYTALAMAAAAYPEAKPSHVEVVKLLLETAEFDLLACEEQYTSPLTLARGHNLQWPCDERAHIVALLEEYREQQQLNNNFMRSE